MRCTLICKRKKGAKSMKYQDLEAAVEYDDVSRLFHDRVLGLHEIVEFQGTSVDELKQAFHKTVNECLQAPTNAQLKQMTLEMPIALHRRFKLATALKHEKMNEIICRLSADHVVQK
jgi:predicted HicB family RNase H-like nuclease